MAQLSNADIADTLERYAGLLELSGESAFRTRAYHQAAGAIHALAEPLPFLQAEGRLRDIPGVGEGIAGVITELLQTDRLRSLEQLSERLPPTLLGILALPGIGIKTVQRLHQTFGITDLPGLEELVAAGRLSTAPGFGKTLQATIAAGLDTLRNRSLRVPLGVALPRGRELVAALQALLPAHPIALAGSIRRMEETVGDVDVVVGSDQPEFVIGRVSALPLVAEVLSRGAGALRVRLQSNLEADILIASTHAFGTALVRATGSAQHVALLGQPLPQYDTETGLYGTLALPWIPPELRQGRDEFRRVTEITGLITLPDINGEFHSHTTWSDGAASVADMAQAARRAGYAFLGISDHSGALGVANGLSPQRLAAQRREIIEANQGVGVRLFAGAEVEVDRDGRLDYSSETLETLDVVIASLHTGLRRDRDELTERLLRVVANHHVDIIAHPSGRLVGRREPGDFDWPRVFDTAANSGIALEINADQARLDLNDRLARMALDAGCLLTINCDAHAANGFRSMEYGVAVARRAWVTPDRVLNCWPLDRIDSWLAERGAPHSSLPLA